jgi:hypothetical protein
VAIPWGLSLKLPSYTRYGLPIALLFVTGSVAVFLLHRSGRHGAVLGVILGIVAAGSLYVSAVIFPLVNPYKSSRFLSQEVTSRIQPGEKLGIYGAAPEAFNFYTGIVPIVELERGENLFQFLRSAERVLCLIDASSFEAFQKMRGMPKVQVISQQAVGGNRFVLISN